jgi:hypothetical protein
MYSAYDRWREPFEDDGELDDESVTCDRCEEKGLTWVLIAVDRWRLVAGSVLHVCKAHLSDFDNLPQ